MTRRLAMELFAGLYLLTPTSSRTPPSGGLLGLGLELAYFFSLAVRDRQ
jgi:hypothetical protein